MLNAYRKDGEITYTGIVREVQKEDGTLSREYCNHGMPTLVESKCNSGDAILILQLH
jgi:hypothetical protein